MKKNLTGMLIAGWIVAGMFGGCGVGAEETGSSLADNSSVELSVIEFSVETANVQSTEQSAEQPVDQPFDQPAEKPVEQRVILGDEQFEAYLPLLEGKRVALFSNHTGIVGDAEDGEHILDALIAQKVNVTAVFSPEHGFRGTEDAGAAVGNSVDEQTGVAIYSLYGGNSAE